MNRDYNFGMIYVYIILFLLLFFMLPQIASVYADFLWFKSLGYESVFIITLSAKVLIFLSVSIIFFIFVSFNSRFADKRGNIDKYIIILVVGIILGVLYSGNYSILLRFLNPTAFGIEDSLFSQDLGFYIFIIPFLRMLQNLAFILVVAGFIASTVLYMKNEDMRAKRSEINWFPEEFQIKPVGRVIGIEISKRVKRHLCFLAALFFFTLAFSIDTMFCIQQEASSLEQVIQM